MNSVFSDFICELKENDIFLSLYDNLRLNYIIDFLGLEDTKYTFVRGELVKLIEYSSILSLSDNFSDIEISQKINSFLYHLYKEDKEIIYGIQMIYIRIGNYPVLKQEGIFEKIIYEDKEIIIDIDLKKEIMDEHKKSIVTIGKKERFISKFQKKILEKINTNKLISVSAPTSFGKSFVIRTYLSQIYSENTNYATLIIVPSKALIDDFMGELLSMKKELGLTFNIVSHFIPEEENIKNKIFILTQERLLAVIRKNPSILSEIDLFYCDEAHKVSSSGRGFLLKKVIEIFNINSPDSKKIFTSPIIKNPEYFKEKFYNTLTEGYTHELVEYKPVEKNIFLFDISKDFSNFDTHFLDNVRGGEYKKFLLSQNKPLLKGIENNSTNKDYYKLDTIINSKLKGGTVIYVNGTEKLIEYAKYLSKSIDEINSKISSDDLKEIKDYIDENFHDGLYIIDFLKKGIGIHVGFLPVGLRNKIVDLFKDKKIKYVLCTSTLLEGVNLPIKNIVLLNKKFGYGKLGKLDFLNLIGRAGRFKYELSGNVILFSDNDINFYDEYFNISSKELEIKDVESTVLTNRKNKLEFVKFFESKGLDSIYRKKNKDVYEHMLYGAYTEKGFINKLGLQEKEEKIIQEIINTNKADIFFDKGILENNLGIAPHSQLKLYNQLNLLDDEELKDFFRTIEDPYSLKGDLTNILQILQDIFFVVPTQYLTWNVQLGKGVFNPVREYMRILDWIKGKQIKNLIDTDLYYYIKGKLKQLSLFIEFKTLTEYKRYLHKNNIVIPLEKRIINMLTYYNNIVGFNWTKYIRVYYNILFEIFKERKIDIGINEEDYYIRVESFLFTLETGINSPLGKYLYSKGLPRSLCLRVNKLIAIFTSDVDEWNDKTIKENFSKKRVKATLKIGLSKISYNELYFNLDL